MGRCARISIPRIDRRYPRHGPGGQREEALAQLDPGQCGALQAGSCLSCGDKPWASRLSIQKRWTFAMQIPLQIVFEHVDHSDLIELHVRKAAGKLEQFYERITSARVVIGKPQHRHHKGDTYSIRPEKM